MSNLKLVFIFFSNESKKDNDDFVLKHLKNLNNVWVTLEDDATQKIFNNYDFDYSIISNEALSFKKNLSFSTERNITDQNEYILFCNNIPLSNKKNHFLKSFNRPILFYDDIKKLSLEKKSNNSNFDDNNIDYINEYIEETISLITKPVSNNYLSNYNIEDIESHVKIVIMLFSIEDIDENDSKILFNLNKLSNLTVIAGDNHTAKALDKFDIKYEIVAQEEIQQNEDENEDEEDEANSHKSEKVQYVILFNDKFNKNIPLKIQSIGLPIVSYLRVKGILSGNILTETNIDDKINLSKDEIYKAFSQSIVSVDNNNSTSPKVLLTKDFDPLNPTMLSILKTIVNLGSGAYRFRLSFYLRFFCLPFIVIIFAVINLPQTGYYFWAIISYICYSVNIYYVLHKKLVKFCYPHIKLAEKFLFRFTLIYFLLTTLPVFYKFDNHIHNLVLFFIGLSGTKLVEYLCLLMSYKYRYREVRFIGFLPMLILFFVNLLPK